MVLYCIANSVDTQHPFLVLHYRLFYSSSGYSCHTHFLQDCRYNRSAPVAKCC